jgi:hypothetical protein
VIPLTHVVEVIELDGAATDEVVTRGERVPLVRLRRRLQAGQGGAEEAAIVVAGMASAGWRWQWTSWSAANRFW